MFAARPFVSSKSFSSKSPSNYSQPLQPSPKKDLPIRSHSRNKSKKPLEVQHDPKDTSFNPASMTDSSRILKDHSNLVSESLFSAVNGHDHSSFSMNLPEDGEKYYKKLLEEMAILKQELAEKNNMNNKLMRENANLRHEMEQFLSTVNDAREFIDIELKECNQRIQDLEEEMQELRTENGILKEQLKNKSVIEQGKRSSRQETDELYQLEHKDMGDFSSKLKEQINQYLETPAEKHQQQHSGYYKNSQPRLHDTKSPSSRTPKSHSSVARQTSPPCQVLRPKTPSGLASRPESTRAQGTMTPGRRSAVPRAAQDKTTRSPSQKLEKGRNGQSSTGKFEGLMLEEGMTSLDLGRAKKSVPTVSSPKASTALKTKLKSDMILQQMKKKLVS